MFWRPHRHNLGSTENKTLPKQIHFQFLFYLLPVASLSGEKNHTVFGRPVPLQPRLVIHPTSASLWKWGHASHTWSLVSTHLLTTEWYTGIFFLVMKCDTYANRWKSQSLCCPNWPAVTRCWAILWHSQRSASELKGWSWERSRTRCDQWRSTWVCCEGASASPACCFLENSCPQSPAQKQHPHVGFAMNQTKHIINS